MRGESPAEPTRSEVDEERRLFQPGDTFSDELALGGNGPELMVIPAGTARLGDFLGEGAYHDGSTGELPPRSVTVPKPFAMSKFEITIGEYNAYREAVGKHLRDDTDGKERHPVKVGKSSTVLYAEWLSQQTGQTYRLPSHEEWEYAARAGTETSFYWGNNPSGRHANGGNSSFSHKARRRLEQRTNFENRWAGPWPEDQFSETTAPVGSYIPNAFGLYDVSGNVSELTCVQSNPGTASKCSKFGLRGGDYDSDPRFLRLSADQDYIADYGGGFRLVREIEDHLNREP